MGRKSSDLGEGNTKYRCVVDLRPCLQLDKCSCKKHCCRHMTASFCLWLSACLPRNCPAEQLMHTTGASDQHHSPMCHMPAIACIIFRSVPRLGPPTCFALEVDVNPIQPKRLDKAGNGGCVELQQWAGGGRARQGRADWALHRIGREWGSGTTKGQQQSVACSSSGTG